MSDKTAGQKAISLAQGMKRFMRQHQNVFEASENILYTVSQVAQGGTTPLGMVLAGVSIVGQVLNVVDTEPTYWPDYLAALGLRDKEFSGTEVLLHGLLLKHYPDPDIVPFGHDGFKAQMWYDPDGNVIAAGVINDKSQYVSGPYTAEHVNMSDLLSECVWEGVTEFTLESTTATHAQRGSSSSSAPAPEGGKSEVQIIPSEGLRPYVRKRPPSWYVDQLRKYPPGPRTVVLRGSSGSGKSVLARHIAAGLRANGRTLKVSSLAVRKLSIRSIQGIVRALRPTVLLLDDMNLEYGADLESLLALLETLRDPDCLTIITMMTDRPDTEPRPGLYYINGMRPGRVDKVWSITLPDQQETEDILALYLGHRPPELPAIADAALGLPGAFLAHLAEELLARPTVAWQDIVAEVLWSAPVHERPRPKAPPVPLPDDDDDDDGTVWED